MSYPQVIKKKKFSLQNTRRMRHSQSTKICNVIEFN